jgi:hypothetical protein
MQKITFICPGAELDLKKKNCPQVMCHKNKHINKPSTTIVQFHSYLRHCYYLGKQHVIILGNEISTEDTVRP